MCSTNERDCIFYHEAIVRVIGGSQIYSVNMGYKHKSKS